MSRAVRGELSRLSGIEYEKFKEATLEKRGYEARRLDGNGEPDILATNIKTGIKSVYSCKCMDFDRPYRLDVLRDQGLTPEVNYAKDPAHEGVALIISVYNLHNRREVKRLGYSCSLPSLGSASSQYVQCFLCEPVSWPIR